ncbi:MAG TPA: hypothetical protein VK960_06990 [Acidimicrobiia bacterium]|nr:hypothetical protein [Acidimicrobiia bacterium]
MNRAFPGVVVVFICVILGACNGSGTEGTGNDPAPITTSTVASTTSTTSTDDSLPERTILKMQADTTYTADDFYAPLSLHVEEAGWWSIEARELWVYLQHHPTDESYFDVDLSILAYEPGASTEALISEIVDSPFTDVLSEPRPTTVAGLDAVVVDVAVPVIPGWEQACEGAVGTVVGYSRFSEIGLALMNSENQPRASFGVRLCRAARIWIVDVDGVTIGIVGGTSTVEGFGDLVGVVDRLVAGIEFEG